MSETDAFLAAIIEEPEDDTPRLVFADYLEEHGESERAEFVRLQIKLARTICSELCSGPARCICFRREWKRREKELLNGSYAKMPCFQHEGLLSKHTQVYVIPKKPGYHGTWKTENGEASFVFRRGFIAEITLSCSDWLQHRDALLKAAPLEKVTLTCCRYAAQPFAFRLTDHPLERLAQDNPVYRTSVRIWLCPHDDDRQPFVCDVKGGKLLVGNHHDYELHILTPEEFRAVHSWATETAAV